MGPLRGRAAVYSTGTPVPTSTATARIVAEGPDGLVGHVRSAFERAGIGLAPIRQDEIRAPDGGGVSGAVLIVASDLDRATALCAGLGPEGRALVVIPEFSVSAIGANVLVIDGAADGREIVTAWRLAGAERTPSGSIAGEVATCHSVFYLTRAAIRLRRTGVLAISRGFRRGELRFVDGELTSAQASYAHGKAAFHQLLLWTSGEFELRDQLLVRRQQIPLSSAGVLTDAYRFLAELRAAAPQISPATIFARNQDQIDTQLSEAPREVWTVVHALDGERRVADILQDSDFRMVETLRLLAALAAAGAIEPRDVAPRPAAGGWDPIDDWLIGMVPTGPEKTGGTPSTPLSTDWSAVIPSGPVQDSGSYSPLVPAATVSGEIEVGSGGAKADSNRETAASSSVETNIEVTQEPAAPPVTAAASDTDTDAATTTAGTGAAASQAGQVAGSNAVVVAEEDRERLESMDASARARIFAAVEASPPAREPESAPDPAPAHREPAAVDGAQATSPAPADTTASAERAGSESDGAPRARRPSRDLSGEIRVVPPRASTADPGGEPSVMIADLAEPGAASTLSAGTSALANEASGAAAAALMAVPVATGPAVSDATTAPIRKPRASSNAEARAVAADASVAAKEATDFSDAEEAFFAAGKELESHTPPPSESFDDLDAGHQRQSFWDRLMGRSRQRPPAARVKSAPAERSSQAPAKLAAEPAKAAPAKSTAETKAEAAKKTSGKKKKRR